MGGGAYARDTAYMPMQPGYLDTSSIVHANLVTISSYSII